MNAFDVLRYGQATFLSELEATPRVDWDLPGVCGRWSTKDVVAHLASYEVVLADVLSGFVGGEPTPDLDRFRALGPDFNDAEVERRRDWDADRVLDEFAAAHTRTLDLINRIPADVARAPGRLPWYGAEYSLDDLLVYLAYGHKREHAAQVALFRDRRRE